MTEIEVRSGRAADKLLDDLTASVEAAAHGDRLPTVRALMERHGVGQATVQSALARLKALGLISAQVGRGIYVVKPDTASHGPGRVEETAPGGALESLLILSNSSMNERCARVQNRIVERMQAIGGRAVQLSYHDTDHLLAILRSVPTFDAIVLQSHYEVIPVRLLGLLQGKARALIVDGHSIAGIDVDRMGVDWEQALGLALDHLVALGHRDVALVSLDSSAQPILSVQRCFDRLDNWRGADIVGRRVVLPGLKHPTQSVANALSRAFDTLFDGTSEPRVSALVFVGISDGMGIREVLRRRGLRTPEDVAVVVLGHPDVPTEHLDLFTIVGGNGLDGAEALFETIRARLAEPSAPPRVVYLDCRIERRASAP